MLTPKLVYFCDDSKGDAVDIVKVYMTSDKSCIDSDTPPYRYHIHYIQEMYSDDIHKSISTRYPHTMDVVEQNIDGGLCRKKVTILVDSFTRIKPEHLFRFTYDTYEHLTIDTVDESGVNVITTYGTYQFIYYTEKRIYPDVGYTARFRVMGTPSLTLAIAMSGNKFRGRNDTLFTHMDGVMFYRIDKNIYRARINGISHYIELTL